MANVNEGEREPLEVGTVRWNSLYGWVAQRFPLDWPRDETLEVVPAKALREAREELERLRELLGKALAYVDGPVPSPGFTLRGELRAVLAKGPSASGSSLASEPKLDGSGR